MSKIKDWFTFSKSERVGILILLSLVVTLIGIKIYFYHFKKDEIKPIDFSSYEKQIDEFTTHLKEQPQKKYTYYQNDTIKKYSGKSYKQYYPANKKTWKNLHIELNSCDTASLTKLYGIGRVLSVRIIKYRERLGGFYNKKQLLEIYGIKPETYQNIKSQIWIDTLKIKKIDLNSVTFKVLLKHPYLNFDQVKKFMKYKDKHWIFKVDQLEDEKVFDKKLLDKMRPYFIVNKN